MKWHRIWAITLRHLLLMHNFNKLASILYWPVLDIMIFGFTGTWLDANDPLAFTTLLSGVILWQLTVRANFGISINFLEEIWSQNLIHLFSSPLTIAEWIIAVAMEGFIMIIITTLSCAAASWFMHGYNIFSLGYPLIPLILLLFIAGLSVGFIAASLLTIWGKRIQSIIFMMGWLFAPLSGAFYAIDVLPGWLKTVAYGLPFFYIFDAMTYTIKTGTFPWTTAGIATGLSAAYLIIGVVCFLYSFNRSKIYGLTQLLGN